MGYQAIGYTTVFTLVYIFPTTSRTITTTQGSQSVPYAIRLLGEGFWNFWIFLGLPRLENSIKRRRRQREARRNPPPRRVDVDFQLQLPPEIDGSSSDAAAMDSSRNSHAQK